MVAAFFFHGDLSLDGARSIEARYGDLARLDAWLARRDRREVSEGEAPPLGVWVDFGPPRWTDVGVDAVLRAVIPGLPFGFDGPAEGDLDADGRCRCAECRAVASWAEFSRLFGLVPLAGRGATYAPQR